MEPTGVELEKVAGGGAALVASGTASGCAWVLWTYISTSDQRPPEERWRPLGGYATQAACEQDRQAMQQKRQDRTPPGARLVTHSCFPDTIDPRGPKGK